MFAHAHLPLQHGIDTESSKIVNAGCTQPEENQFTLKCQLSLSHCCLGTYLARLSRAIILSAESASNFTMPSPSSMLIRAPIRPLFGPVMPFT